MSFFSFKRVFAISQKEFKHILRDPFTLMMALLLPFLIVLILGNSIEFNIKSIDLAYIDHDKTQSSRKLIETFASSHYFKPYNVETPQKGMDDLTNEKAKIVLFIPPDFEKDIFSKEAAKVQVILDGADNSSVSAVMNYLNTINVQAVYKIKNVPIANDSPLTLKSRYLFNPELNSKWFSIPGISSVIIAIVAIMLTTLTVCKEWEQGSMEMLLTTPVKSSEIIIGKLLPYAVLSLSGFLIVFVTALFIFKIPFVGSFALLLLSTVLFIFGYLSMGMFISVVSHEQQIAVQYAAVIGLLPTMLFSGFIFPIEYMPDFFQKLSMIFPARFYVEIARDQFLKGSSITTLLMPLIILTTQFSVWTCLCFLKFKRTIE